MVDVVKCCYCGKYYFPVDDGECPHCDMTDIKNNPFFDFIFNTKEDDDGVSSGRE